ncbi:unnamed protein product [Lactuca virosa]|uniref:Uncharacterized protein n=1 Tax=Lactuca virosa TaxID=75947 RepID=A0AAU9LRI0_9ASTR|nr:unnamed protein product [Lactuca virosa]
MGSNSSDICSPKKFEDVDGKVKPQSNVSKSTCHSDSESVEIIECSLQSLKIPVGEGDFGREFEIVEHVAPLRLGIEIVSRYAETN